MVKPLGLPRDSLERRRGGRGGPAPRRDRMDNGERVAKRMHNDYNSQFKKKDAAGRSGVEKSVKKKGFNPMARAHMGSEAYKGHGMYPNYVPVDVVVGVGVGVGVGVSPFVLASPLFHPLQIDIRVATIASSARTGKIHYVL
ncbi:hypothetical protein EDD11_001687 [Mortierella claussenii]|nr:hypothetical protein EDD11_001687 [Mortierella claussenii]